MCKYLYLNDTNVIFYKRIDFFDFIFAAYNKWHYDTYEIQLVKDQVILHYDKARAEPIGCLGPILK